MSEMKDLTGLRTESETETRSESKTGLKPGTEAETGDGAEKNVSKEVSRVPLWKFILPSVSGILFFMVPVRYDGGWTLPVKILANLISQRIGEFLPILCAAIVTVSGFLTVVLPCCRRYLESHPALKRTFSPSTIWKVIRVLGTVFILLTYFGIGDGNPVLKYIVSSDTGAFILSDLLCSLVIIFLIASFLLPLLLNFGLPEFIGALMTRVMRPLFSIPGRAAVDALTSWIGDGTLGVMLSVTQYEQGYYSKREAATITTTFSAVSITFAIIVLSQVDLLEYFGLYYLLICLVGFVCAMIVPRIPPLSLKKDEYLVAGKAMGEDIPPQYRSLTEYGLALAKRKIASGKGFGEFLLGGLGNAMDMCFGVLPVVMCIGTVSLIIANYTPVFDYLGAPFRPLLEFLQVPQAAEASKTMVVGFCDMFIPSIIAAETIQTEMTRFIVATISVTQLIYLSEIGGLILGSKIPINIFELFVIFLERTLISLMIIVPVAHLVF